MKMLALIVLLISFPAVLDTKNIAIGPRNVAVIAGKPMSMTCELTSKGSLQWKYKYPGQVGETNLYNGTHGLRIYSVTKTDIKETVTLTKTNTQPEDAGLYTCIRSGNESSSSFYSAELLVLPDGPECGNTINDTNLGIMEGGFINMWCRISYVGNMLPVMTWFRSSINQSHCHNESQMTQKNSTTVPSLTIKTSFYNVSIQLNSSDNGFVIGFECHFIPLTSDESSQVIKATNIPDYVFRWNFTPVVYYGPRNISVDPLKSSYRYGNILHCHSDGNPPPIYRWISTDGSQDSKEGSTFTIDESLAFDEMYSYQCVVISPISGENISQLVNITVLESSGANNSSQTMLFLSILLPIFGAIVILNFGLILQKRILRRKIIEVNAKYENTEQIYDDANQTTASTPSVTSTYETVTTVTETTVGDGTLVGYEQSTTPPYSNLTGTRTLPVPAVYSKLEKEFSPSKAFETPGDRCSAAVEHYVNVQDIRLLDKKV